MYVYADVVFIINIVMNCVILLLTAWIAGVNYKLWRILLAATVGSGYVLVGILPGLTIVNHVLCKVFMSLILIVLGFGIKSGRRFVLLMASFYMVAFILGGAVVGWIYFWQTSTYFGSSDMFRTHLSWTHLLWGSCVGIFLMILVVRRMLPRMNRHHNLYQVKVEYEGRTVELTGMLDTGNGLYTVIGRKPAILVNRYALEPILSTQVVAFLRNNAAETWLTNLDKCVDLAWLSRIHVIPYHTISSKSTLLAFRPDRFMVSSKTGFIDTSDMVIGIYSGTLSGDGAYAVLLHPQIMNELSKKEGASICA